MSFFRTISKLFAGQPYILHMHLTPEKVHITVRRSEQVISHDELLKLKSLPPPFVQFLNTQSSDTSGYFVGLPTAHRLSAALQPYSSDSFQLDTTEVDQLQRVECPDNFKILWQFDHSRQVLMRMLVGADGYLGEGWFFRGKQAWQPSTTLNYVMVNWLDKPEIESRLLYRFVAQGFSLFKEALYQCDLKIETGFQARLQILKTLKQSLDIQIISNMPEIQKHLETIEGDEQNLISRTTLLPGWHPKLRGKLFAVAKSEQPTRLNGNDLLTFIQDDLTPTSTDLNFDLTVLSKAYPIDDAAKLPLKWSIEHAIVQGVGQYQAIPNLQTVEELIPITKIARQIETKSRFLNVGDRWLEFTSRFKERYSEWQQKNIRAIKLAPQEIMGANVERLAKLGLRPPVIEVSKATAEQDQIRILIDTMRQHGLPLGIYGLQQEMGRILAETCTRLLRENRRATILWIVPKRKQQEIAGSLKKAGTPFSTDQIRLLEGHVLLASPENLVFFNTDWTLIIFSDLDTLASGEQQSKTLAIIRRAWSISTFTRSDWYRDTTRAQRILQVLNLSKNDLSTFVKLCTGSYTKQVDSLLSRLTSPFKRITVSTDTLSNESGDVPIPPRVASNEPRPLREVEKVYRPTFSVSVSVSSPRNSFLEEAKRLAKHIEPATEPVPFMQYWPTYDAMTNAQKKWYFYWRSQVRQGSYLTADLSYVFVHIYEIVHLVGFANAQSAVDYLINLWQQYRAIHTKLDRYLIDWIADFHAVHHLSRTPLEWYAIAMKLGGRLTDQNLAIEAWLSQNEDIGQIPESLLNLISEYQPAKSKFVQQHNLDQSVDRDLRKSLQQIDVLLRQKDGKSLFERNRPLKTLAVRRRPFAGSVYEGSHEDIMIGTVPLWTSADELRSSTTAILKYTENLLRRQRNFKGSLRGIELPLEWAQLLDDIFPAPVTETKVSKQRKSKSNVVEANTPSITPILIDYSRVNALTQESDEVRDRLTVEDAPDETAISRDLQTVDVAAKEPSVETVDNIELNVDRPDDTPAHLLTDLNAVHEVISGDPIAIRLFNYLKQHNWEIEADTTAAILEGAFLNVILDRINERALIQLGDQLIVLEDHLLVVTEDYRDELQHMLTQPVTQKVVQAVTGQSKSAQDLTPEWAEFVQKMKPQHWEALNALLTQEDVLSRLDGIARSVYTTADLLIDDINEFALTSIGDIVIETGDIPTIEAEDFETLHALMLWALENVIQEI